KFVKNPFVEGERIYKTGDLARWLPDGTIEFLGRIDNQVKIRGFRIELGEIEARLEKHEKIKEAVVIAKEDENKNKYLCGYIVSDEDIPMKELRAFLSQELPEYMIPTYFVKMDKFPLNLNGKVDKNVLYAIKEEFSMGRYIAPKTELEKKLINIIEDILGINDLSMNDNFFNRGGNSILMVQLISELENEFGEAPSVVTIMRAKTILELAEKLEMEISQEVVV
ncbi:non-ribosomal peptide synthetase, partial [Paramaledivibacter caminithermalis]